MILFFFLLFFINSGVGVEAATFSKQFVFKNNIIDLNFLKKIDLEPIKPIAEPIVTGHSLTPDRILSFRYKIKQNRSLPSDLPLFIVVLDNQVIFYADASLADDSFHQVEIDLRELEGVDSNHTPIFYQNNYLISGDFELVVQEIKFTNISIPDIFDFKINNLNAIRENDQSLTLIFEVVEDTASINSYKLACLNHKQEVVFTTKLSQADSVFWPLLSFVKFLRNSKNEIIFHLSEFNCEGLVYVEANSRVKSTPVSIINIKDL